MKKLFYNGMTHFYDQNTHFKLQTGRYENCYQTLSTSIGWPDEIIYSYEKMHVENGYKKRIIMIHLGEQYIIAREISKREKNET